MSSHIYNPPAPNVSYFTPAQYRAAGAAAHSQPDGKTVPELFQPIRIRGVEFHNRLFLAPLCQYSAEDGIISPWHLAHLGGIISRGPGLSIVEASAVLPEGRISPEDAGIWNDVQSDAWRTITEFAHSQNQKIGIQLAHAGRKASTVAPWLNLGKVATEVVGGWTDLVAPSAVPYKEDYLVPQELDKAGLGRIVRAFADAAKRSVRAGFDVIEIHGAHGFLLSSFLSPTANKRTDEYGGSFENRIRFPLEVVDAIRAVIPPGMPLFFRISATDWLEESLPNEPSWRLEDTVRLAPILAEHGVDLFDISSSGNHPAQKIKAGPAYQVPFSSAVKAAMGDKILVGAVGSITDGRMAQDILEKGQADIIFVGRLFQKNPSLVWSFAEDLGVSIHAAHQIEWPFAGRGGGSVRKGV
ncbi:FMN-linked oxidoreductase [Obba rivulosa]|uniref:FMN-linked oxidoreductase n=1 Tax=Obba rivulosa TaxID=1052685 RepID=A0A8E2DMB9_9APHY|nr:FMN-linked oxidoreductase [Obba rivulosa]